MRWVADENLRNAILRGIQRRRQPFDFVRAQDMPAVAGRDDETLLVWATEQERTVLSHDVTTLVPAMRRVLAKHGRCTPIVLVPEALPIGLILEQLLLLDECAVASDWNEGVIFLPLR